MLFKLFNVLLVILAVQNVCGVSSDGKHLIDISQYNAAYYDAKTGVGLKPELEDSGRNPFSAKIAFRSSSCQCKELRCDCCTGFNITAIKFNRVACTKLAWDPEAVGINMSFVMNEKEIYSNTISAKNPPPLCIPFPYVPILNICIRFYDVHTVGKNIHACIDLETRIVGSPILILHFNCVKMGADGVSFNKPGEGDDAVAQQVQQEVAAPEVYDEVEFEQQDLEVYANYTSTLTPEEEAQIGQLKL